MSVMKANSARRAEKALREILDKADDNANGRVRLKDFLEILDANDVKMEDEELEVFSGLVDDNGEIAKHDLIVQSKQSSFWKGNMDLKNKPGSHSTKAEAINSAKNVEVMNKTDRTGKADTAFKLFDKNKDGFITREEFAQVSKKLTKKQIDAVFAKFDGNGDGRLSREEFQQLMADKKK